MWRNSAKFRLVNSLRDSMWFHIWYLKQIKNFCPTMTEDITGGIIMEITKKIKGNKSFIRTSLYYYWLLSGVINNKLSWMLSVSHGLHK